MNTQVSKKSIMNNEMPHIINSILIQRTLLLCVALFILCTITRGIMVAHYLPMNLWQEHLSDFGAMWLMGAKLDMRSIGIALLIFVALHYITQSLCFIAYILTGGGAKHRIYSFLSQTIPHIYTFLLGFVFMAAAIINFYYFRTYGSKIDIFIFGFKDDDTLAILSIMWQDYPLVIGVLCAIAFGIFCLYLYKIPLFSLFMRFAHFTNLYVQILYLVCVQLLLIALLLIAARGSLGTFPIKEDNHYISTLPIFNHLATNPLIAFDWAQSNYKEAALFHPPVKEKGEQLESLLFPISHTSADSVFLRENPPHIVLNLMESFGSNMLIFDDKDTNDLLGALRRHFNEDFVFYRFLSGANGTAPSLAALFFDSPSAQISLGAHKKTSLMLNPFFIYANAGYEVVYITSGYASWQGLGEFIITQGAHKVYDMLTLLERFPQSKNDKNTYGVPDEYAYNLAFEILQNATKPTFIAILTTSNHPPYHLPQHYVPKPIALSDTLKNKAKNQAHDKLRISALLYQYANDTFGYFMNMLKASPLAQNTIVAASGDHRLRDFNSNTSTDKALYYAVPLYLYVPQMYATQTHYDPTRIGSHKDIFPTLYELSLSQTPYISVGGRNILAPKDDKRRAFGYNQAVWIDENGIYPFRSEVGYMWADSKEDLGLLSTDTSFSLNEYQKHFGKRYWELFEYAISYRIFKEE